MIVGKLILETRDVGPEAKEFTVSRPPPSVAQWAVAFAAIVAAALLTDGLPVSWRSRPI